MKLECEGRCIVTGYGQVLHVFEHACDLSIPSGLVALVRRPAPMTSWGILVSSEPFTATFAVGEPCAITADSVTIGGKHFARSKTKWLNDQIPRKTIPDSAYKRLFRFLAEQGFPGLTVLLAKPTSFGIVGAYLDAAKNAACELVNAKNQHDFLHAARKLVGLGIGLTPSGDDFLGGYLAGLFAETRSDLESYLKPLADLSLQTTPLAGQFLRMACQGSFSEHLVQLVCALQKDDPTAIIQQARHVLAFGSSSGADTIAGLLYFGLRGKHGEYFRHL